MNSLFDIRNLKSQLSTIQIRFMLAIDSIADQIDFEEVENNNELPNIDYERNLLNDVINKFNNISENIENDILEDCENEVENNKNLINALGNYIEDSFKEADEVIKKSVEIMNKKNEIIEEVKEPEIINCGVCYEEYKENEIIINDGCLCNEKLCDKCLKHIVVNKKYKCPFCRKDNETNAFEGMKMIQAGNEERDEARRQRLEIFRRIHAEIDQREYNPLRIARANELRIQINDLRERIYYINNDIYTQLGNNVLVIDERKRSELSRGEKNRRTRLENNLRRQISLLEQEILRL